MPENLFFDPLKNVRKITEFWLTNLRKSSQTFTKIMRNLIELPYM